MINNNLKASHQKRIDKLREADRKKLGFSFARQVSEFDRVVEFIAPPVSEFVLYAGNQKVWNAYQNLIKPKR